eukprot:m.247611 g.247611  ORF g.247611 m.247611 type:complete len:388 (-) comp16128_c0_seq10:43-1206(-)
MLLLLTCATLVAGNKVNNSIAPLVLFTDNIGRCLDGSHSGMYFRSATSSNATEKWMFVLEGGGLCTGKDDCTSRSHTHLGSSKYFDSEFNLDSVSLTCTDPRNPFHDWNMVYVPYCDGSMWSGARTTASNDTYGLYFSGHNTIESMLVYLSANHNLNASGNFIVFSGGSAGGIGVFNNYEYVAERLQGTVVGAPVGGFPPAVEWYTGKNSSVPEEDAHDSAFQAHYNLYGAHVNQACFRALIPSNEEYKCLVPHLAYHYMTTPMFILEAITDAVVMCGFEGLACDEHNLLTNKQVWNFINDYADNATQNFLQVNATRDGLYAPSCLMHTGFELDKPLINGVGAVDALYKWATPYMHGETPTTKSIYVDSCKIGKYFPPCNGHCPPLP